MWQAANVQALAKLQKELDAIQMDDHKDVEMRVATQVICGWENRYMHARSRVRELDGSVVWVVCVCVWAKACAQAG